MFAMGLCGSFQNRLAMGEPSIEIESRPGNAEFHQGAAHRQMGVLDELDDLQLFASRIPHAASAPSAVKLFLSRRFSRVSSATTSFRADASRRRSLTSSEVDAGLLAYRELDDALGLSAMATVLADARTGKNGRHALVGLPRQSVFDGESGG